MLDGQLSNDRETPPPGEIDSTQTTPEAAADDDSDLVGLLQSVMKDHGGRGGAAAELKVSERTVRRSLIRGRLTQRLRVALQVHKMLLKGAESPDSPLVKRLKALEERMGRVEDEAAVQGELVGRIGVDIASLRSELAGRVTKLEHVVEGVTADVRELKVDRPASSQASPPTAHASLVTSSSTRRASTSGQTAPVASAQERKKEALWSEWEAAKAAYAVAQTNLEKAIALERRWEAEIKIIHDTDDTIPLGELWGSVVRSREWERACDRLEDAQRDRRRYERRRCIRRVLTLGLWRS